MELNIDKKEFQALLRLIKCYPEVTIMEANFNKKNTLSAYITTKGKWPQKLVDAFRKLFPLPKGIPFLLVKRNSYEDLPSM